MLILWVSESPRDFIVLCIYHEVEWVSHKIAFRTKPISLCLTRAD